MNPREMLDKALAFLGTRKRNYQLCFGSPAGREVLKDLAIFCRANRAFIMPGDHDRSLLAAGRNEVWLRIWQHVNFSPDELAVIYRAAAFEKQGDDNG